MSGKRSKNTASNKLKIVENSSDSINCATSQKFGVRENIQGVRKKETLENISEKKCDLRWKEG